MIVALWRPVRAALLVALLCGGDVVRAAEVPSIIETLPLPHRLYREHGLAHLDSDEIALEVDRLYPTIAASEAEVSLNGPDEIGLLFALVTALQELERRDALTLPQRAGLVKLGVNLHELGERWQRDPAMRRQFDTWKDLAPSESALVLMVELEVSLERAAGYTRGWMPTLVAESRRLAGKNPALDLAVARWLLSEGDANGAAQVLLQTGPGERSVAFGLTMYRALRQAGRDDEAVALRADLVQSLPGAVGQLDAIDAEARNKAEEEAFLADADAQPLDAWMRHVDRHLRAGRVDEAAIAMQRMLARFPDEVTAPAYVARALLSWGDLRAAQSVLDEAAERGLRGETLDSARLAGAIAAQLRGEPTGPGAPFADVDVQAGLDGLRRTDRANGKLVAQGLRVLLAEAARRQVDPEVPEEAVVAEAALLEQVELLLRKHRKREVAVMGAAAVLSGREQYTRAQAALADASKRVPAEARGRIALARARTALMQACHDDDESLLGTVGPLLDQAEKGGVPAHLVALERLWVEMAKTTLTTEGWPERAVVTGWIDQLVDLDRSLDPSDPGDRDRSAAVALSVAALAMHLDAYGQAESSLTQARGLGVEVELTQLMTGQMRVFVNDPSGALTQLHDARRAESGVRWLFLVDKWLLLAASRVGDRTTFRDVAGELLAIWDAAEAPDVVETDAPLLLTRGAAGLAFTTPLDGPLGLGAGYNPTLVLVHGMPHDRAVIRQLAGQ